MKLPRPGCSRFSMPAKKSSFVPSARPPNAADARSINPEKLAATGSLILAHSGGAHPMQELATDRSGRMAGSSQAGAIIYHLAREQRLVHAAVHLALQVGRELVAEEQLVAPHAVALVRIPDHQIGSLPRAQLALVARHAGKLRRRTAQP